MKPRRLCAAFAVPAALALAACSSSTSGTGTSTDSPASPPTSSAPTTSAAGKPASAAALGRRLQSGVASVRSAHISMNISAGGQAITGSGDEKLANGKLRAMHLTENVGGSSIELVIAGGKTYIKLPAALSHSRKPWTLVSQHSSNPAVKQIASTLDSALSSVSIGDVSAFVNSASSVRNDGKATVGGVDTTHYSVAIDVAKLPASLPGREQLQASGLAHLPLELYVDGQGRPVQVSESFTVASQKIATKVLVTKYNQPVTITAPPASQVGNG